ncbi:hypothetical protein BOX15_Mlig021282g3 [Macrostomum lignano]|uniref:Uncharacterized protein n=1 Tax=Macrostomum lignano TaxID=282301 RepID=A0A267FAM2_9PLAT|nr:hypothetical protein BOX15_Mlig021282g3 [Macrostomum lignano]
MCGADRCKSGINCRANNTGAIGTSWLSRNFPSLLLFPSRSPTKTSAACLGNTGQSDGDRDKDKSYKHAGLCCPSPPKRMKLCDDVREDGLGQSGGILLAECLPKPRAADSTAASVSPGGGVLESIAALSRKRKNSTVFRDLNAVAPNSF